MDPISVSIGTLGLIESLDKIVGRYQDILRPKSGDAKSEEVFGEIMILLWVLDESKMLTDELVYQPASLIIALQRCKDCSAQLEKLLHNMSKRSAMALAVQAMSTHITLRETFTTFKSAVILFRDIATNALTIQLLKNGSGTGRAPINSLHLDKSKPSADSPNKPSISTRQQIDSQGLPLSTPAEKSSLFNATISLIAERNPSSLPQSQRDAFKSPCECGRIRMGIWYPVRGKFDSGSNVNFIAEEVVKRAGLESFVFKAEDTASLKMFGHTFSFHEKISLSWQLNNDGNSYSNDFWVAPNVDNFDLVIGEPWLIEHGYDIIETHRSQSITSSFFGYFNLKLPSSRKDRKAEDAVAAQKLADAKEKSRQRREAALGPSTQAAPMPDLSAVAGSASTGTTGQSTSASQTSIASSSVTPTTTIIGPVASSSIPHTVPNPTNTQNIKPGSHMVP